VKFGLREILFIVMLTAIPVAAWWFVFRPNNQRNGEMLRQIEAEQVRLRELNLLTATVGNLTDEIDSLQEAIRFFQSKLPPEKEMDKVMKGIWLLAEANHLTTKSIRQLDRKRMTVVDSDDDTYARQPISVVLEGDFMGLYAFLQTLENQPRILRVHQLHLKKVEGSEGRVQADLTMSIFFERNQEGRS